MPEKTLADRLEAARERYMHPEQCGDTGAEAETSYEEVLKGLNWGGELEGLFRVCEGVMNAGKFGPLDAMEQALVDAYRALEEASRG